jgi:hypothetical protein
LKKYIQHILLLCYCIKYSIAPGVLVEGVIAPVEGLRDKPADELKVPPEEPVL